MDSTVGFYPTNVGSIPAGQTNGVGSSAVESRIVIPVVVGSNPIQHPSNTPVDELVESLLLKGRRKNLVEGSNPSWSTKI